MFFCLYYILLSAKVNLFLQKNWANPQMPGKPYSHQFDGWPAAQTHAWRETKNAENILHPAVCALQNFPQKIGFLFTF